MPYVHGTSAYKLEVKVKQRERRSNFFLIKLLGVMFVMFVFIMFIQWRDSQILELRGEIEAKQQTLFRLQAENKQMKVELDRQLDMKAIEEIAITRLNMHKPYNNQIVYLNVDKPDIGEVVKTEQGQGFFDFLLSEAGKLLAYLH